jgi:hypothetical protein
MIDIDENVYEKLHSLGAVFQQHRAHKMKKAIIICAGHHHKQTLENTEGAPP